MKPLGKEVYEKLTPVDGVPTTRDQIYEEVKICEQTAGTEECLAQQHLAQAEAARIRAAELTAQLIAMLPGGKDGLEK